MMNADSLVREWQHPVISEMPIAPGSTVQIEVDCAGVPKRVDVIRESQGNFEICNARTLADNPVAGDVKCLRPVLDSGPLPFNSPVRIIAVRSSIMLTVKNVSNDPAWFMAVFIGKTL